MRSPEEMDILQIDLTNRCMLSCSNCTRLVAHQTKTKEMTPETFRKALASLQGWWKPGKVVGLIGGEPTLCKHFAEIARIFREEFNPERQVAIGRQPIKDFNAFAQERLFDRTSGRGLWTSLGERFYKHYETICDTFDHWNTNDHSAGGLHQSLLIDRKELMAALNIPEHMWTMYRDSCWVQNQWSATITPRGKAYFCEVAAHLDELYNDGQRGWDLEPGWWKKKPEEFGDQLDICEMCALCLPGPSQVDAKDQDIISFNHTQRLIQIGSPAVKRDQYELYNSEDHGEKRLVQTKDSYVAGDRVSQDNESVRPRKLSCVVVCVGRAHHLASTLRHNMRQVDELIVVTHPKDADTIEIASAAGARVVQSVRCHDWSAAFNKGAMINDGLAAIGKPDWIVLTDADVMLSHHLRSFIKSHALNPGVLYGTLRHDIPHSEAPYFASGVGFALDPATAKGINAEPNGYFQLFHHTASALKGDWPNVMSEEFCSAGGVDSWFLQQFPADKRVVVDSLRVFHIKHDNELGRGWNGKKRKGTWRQTAMLCASGLYEIEPIPKAATHLKLTDTKHGHSVILEMADPDFLKWLNGCFESDGNGGFIFDRLDIGRHHIHVAYYRP